MNPEKIAKDLIFAKVAIFAKPGHTGIQLQYGILPCSHSCG